MWTYNQLADLWALIFDILRAYNDVIFITSINTMHRDNYRIMIAEAVIIDSKIFVVIHIPSSYSHTDPQIRNTSVCSSSVLKDLQDCF